jgi:hypothetical protein
LFAGKLPQVPMIDPAAFKKAQTVVIGHPGPFLILSDFELRTTGLSCS